MPFLNHLQIVQPLECDTLCVALDYDGCMDTHDARNLFIENMLDYLQQHRAYRYVRFFMGSLRQNIFIDYLNAALYRQKSTDTLNSCRILIDAFFRDFTTRLYETFSETERPSVSFEPILTGDIFYDLEPGSMLTKMSSDDYTSIYQQNKTLDAQIKSWRGGSITVASWVDGKGVDRTEPHPVLPSKLDIIYMIAHYVGRQQGPHRQFCVLFFDDKMDILTSAARFFEANRSLLPRTASFQGLEFNTQQTALGVTRMVTGSGRINIQYEIFLRALYALVKEPRNIEHIGGAFWDLELHRPRLGATLYLPTQKEVNSLVPPRRVQWAQKGVSLSLTETTSYRIIADRIPSQTAGEQKHTLYVYGLMVEDWVAVLRLAMLYLQSPKESSDLYRAINYLDYVFKQALSLDRTLAIHIGYLLACIYRDVFDLSRAMNYYQYMKFIETGALPVSALERDVYHLSINQHVLFANEYNRARVYFGVCGDRRGLDCHETNIDAPSL